MPFALLLERIAWHIERSLVGWRAPRYYGSNTCGQSTIINAVTKLRSRYVTHRPAARASVLSSRAVAASGARDRSGESYRSKSHRKSQFGALIFNCGLSTYLIVDTVARADPSKRKISPPPHRGRCEGLMPRTRRAAGWGAIARQAGAEPEQWPWHSPTLERTRFLSHVAAAEDRER